jgi:hypothetical protein
MAGVYTNRKSHAISNACVTFLKTHLIEADLRAQPTGSPRKIRQVVEYKGIIPKNL